MSRRLCIDRKETDLHEPAHQFLTQNTAPLGSGEPMQKTAARDITPSDAAQSWLPLLNADRDAMVYR
jgi:hypothetical protein